MAYMVYRLIALYEPLTGDPTTDPYFFSRKTMTVFGKCSMTFVWCIFLVSYSHCLYLINDITMKTASLTLFMTILAFWNAIVMYMNFNKGLKEASKVDKRSSTSVNIE